MNGPTNIMVATPAIFDDLSSNIFKENCRNNYKNDHFSLVNMATIICINLEYLSKKFQEILNSFNHKPFLMTFLENKEA